MSVKPFRSIAGTLLNKGPSLLPQTATATVYTVSGLVLITGLFAVFTSVTTNPNCTYTIGPASFGAGASLTNPQPVVGQCLVPQLGTGTTSGQVEVLQGFPLYQENFVMQYFLINSNITLTTNANVNAQLQWYCWWLPFTPGSSVS